MARATAAAPLTQLSLRTIKAPATGRADYPDGATPGLCLRVTANNVRTWTLRMRDAAGKLRRITLGPANGNQGLAWARRQADAMRQDVRHNRRDPKRERADAIKAAQDQAERDRLTLGVLVADWRRLRLGDRTPGYAAEAERAIHYAFGKEWDRPAADLDRKRVARVLAGCKPVMASRTAAYGRACFQWAIKRELLSLDPFTGHDVARVVRRERVLSETELADMWRASLADTGLHGPIVRLLLLTGQRKQEVAGMDWSELSADLATWTMPGERTKNGKPSIVPLSTAAQAQLPAIRGEGLVFPGEGNPRGPKAFKPGFQAWSKAKTRLDATITKVRAIIATEAGADPVPFPAWRLHDLRRTCATGLQRLGIQRDVTEAVLNHVSGTGAGIVGIYQRHHWTDEKRVALDTWGVHVLRLTSGHSGADNIVPIMRAV